MGLSGQMETLIKEGRRLITVGLKEGRSLITVNELIAMHELIAFGLIALGYLM